MTDERSGLLGKERAADERAGTEQADQDPTAEITWAGDCGSGCGCLGDPGTRPERAGRAPQPRTTPSSPGAKGFPEPWGSVMAAMVGGRGTISTCCDPRAGEEAGPSTDDSAEVSTNHGA